MKNLILLLLLTHCVFNLLGQDSARIYMNKDFEIVDDINNATFIRDALFKNERYYLSDRYVDGRMILKGEYSSVNPWIEDGLFTYYDFTGRLYAYGSFENGNMSGKWIYYDSINIDTVFYKPEWNEIIKNDLKILNQGEIVVDNKKILSKKFGEIIVGSEELYNYINSKVHYPPRMLLDCYDLTHFFQVQTDNKKKEKQLAFNTNLHNDFRIESYRIFQEMPDSLIYKIDEDISLYNIGILYTCNNAKTKETTVKDTADANNCPTYLYVDNEARFQDGTIENFRQWVQMNITYPSEAVQKRESGRVSVQFIVTCTGELNNIQILRSSGSVSIDNEAIRIVKKSPKWRPAMHDGTIVNQQFVMPVIFQIK